MSITSRARALHPNRKNAAKWVLAVRYLRTKNIWILDGGKRPNWGNK
jgi:hypothetical protein